MRNSFAVSSSFSFLLIFSSSISEAQYYTSRPASFSSPDWVQTNGPGGGFISTVRLDPENPQVVYAAGPRDGIYKSSDGGLNWRLIHFDQPALDPLQNLALAPRTPSTLFCSSHLDLLKSTDGGETWQDILSGIAQCNTFVRCLELDPREDILYLGTGVHYQEECAGVAGTIYLTVNGGAGWTDIGETLPLPGHAIVEDLGLLGEGKILAGINDQDLTTWRRGKLFYSGDNGKSWSEIAYGASQDRFIWSIFVNPYTPGEVWLSEGPLYNDPIDQPFLYLSADSGQSWRPVTVSGRYDNTQVRVIGASPDGRVYVAAGASLLVTGDRGGAFTNIEPEPDEMTATDFRSMAISPVSPEILFLPLRSGGIGYSGDGGGSWSLRNQGILSTEISLLAADPADPAVVYAASAGGVGTFRSDDFGESWLRLNTGGIVHPWGDELLVDPLNPDNVWFVSDVPHIHVSSDKGNTWRRINNPYEGGSFNFCSVYALAQSADEGVLYALNNGFGIFKGRRFPDPGHWEWEFLNLSEVDYTYSLTVAPGNTDMIFSGYSRKPFQTAAKVMGSFDGGREWFQSLLVEGAEAVTSVVIDPADPDRLFAASTGESGGALWRSTDRGASWRRANEFFNFTTIHSFAVAGEGSAVAFAGVWGGGTYKTSDYGETWGKLEAPESFSAAAFAVDPADPRIIYLADRTAPVLYRSTNSGADWSVWFDAGSGHRRLMNLTLDPSSGRIYVSTMKSGGLGKEGALFRIDKGAAAEIGGALPKLALKLAVDPNAPATLYAVLHESGVYKSVDGGGSWTELSSAGSGLPVSGFLSIFLDPNDSRTLYLTGGSDVRFETVESAGLDPDSVNGVYRSRDGGLSWENINRGVLGAASGAVKSLVFYRGGSQVIYLGAENGVYYSTDSGASWKKADGLSYSTLGGIAVSGQTVYAFTNGAGLFRGTINSDYSITWKVQQKVVAPVYFAQVLKDPEVSEVLYASGYPGGIFKSIDSGETWHEKNFGMPSFQVEDPLRQGYYALDISPSDPDVLFLGLYKKGVYRSFNSAATWYPVNGAGSRMADKPITAIRIHPQDPDRVYVSTEEGVYVTADGGRSWSELNQGLSSTDIRTLHFSSSGELYAGSRGYGIFRLEQGAWEAQSGFGNFGIIWPMWNDRPLYQYTSLLIHPEDNSRILLGTFPQGIYKSADGGVTWRESNLGWTNDGVFCLVSRPDNPEIVYAGTYNGINRSLDFGGHWELWDNGWPGEQWVFSIDFSPEDPRVMYACSKNGENEGTGREGFRGTVMKSVDGGAQWSEITRGLELNQEFYKIIADRFDPRLVYLATQHEGVFISRDAGQSWESWNGGLTNPVAGTNGNNVTNTMALSADHSVLYFGSSGSGVFRRTITPVLPVSNLSASLYRHRVILSWRFEDLNRNFKAFKIYRAEKKFDSLEGLSSRATLAGAGARQFEDISVSTGIPYFYAVTTTDVSGYENERFTVLGPVVLTGQESPLEPGENCDFSGNGEVSLNDVLAFLLLFRDNPLDSRLDRNGDGRRNISDALALLSDIRSGRCGAAPSALAAAGSGRVEKFVLGLDRPEFEYLEKILGSPELSETDRADLRQALSRVSDRPALPGKFSLSQNNPNPFNPSTTINYTVPDREPVRLQVNVYDLRGRLIRNLVDGPREPGSYTLVWDARDTAGNPAASGVYLYRLKAGRTVIVKKMVLLK